MIKRLHGYPKVWNMGHPAIAELFNGPVVVQEKVDGSQFTFGLIGGRLLLRSKGAEIHGVEGADKLFRGAAETAQRLMDAGLLNEGWQYRGEAMMSHKHNTLAYGRAPKGNFILFDVDTGLENRISDPEELAALAATLDLEVVPTLHVGEVPSLDALRALLDRESILGGAKVEGVVAKNYARWGRDGKMLMGKVVSDDFKEKHTAAWGESNPKKTDHIERLKETYRTDRRWEKSIQHAAENGTLEHSPRDIGALLKAIQSDVYVECREEIASALFDAFWPEIRRGLTAGFPEWYKARLLERQFATTEVES